MLLIAGCDAGCVSVNVVRIHVLLPSAHQRCVLGHSCEDEVAHSGGAGLGGGGRGGVGSRRRSWARDGPEEEGVMLEERSRVERRTERRWRGLRWGGPVSVGVPFFFPGVPLSVAYVPAWWPGTLSQVRPRGNKVCGMARVREIRRRRIERRREGWDLMAAMTSVLNAIYD